MQQVDYNKIVENSFKDIFGEDNYQEYLDKYYNNDLDLSNAIFKIIDNAVKTSNAQLNLNDYIVVEDRHYTDINKNEKEAIIFMHKGKKFYLAPKKDFGL